MAIFQVVFFPVEDFSRWWGIQSFGMKPKSCVLVNTLKNWVVVVSYFFLIFIPFFGEMIQI